ncbi:hypothetical protein ACE0DR_14420 [Azotobacter sp. CWF10]
MPAARPTAAERALATPLVASSAVSLSLVRLATEDMPALEVRALAAVSAEAW